MMRSLFSGVAGLKTHQTKMDVIGNNIANVNTTAFKSQSVTFSDLMYQTTQKASGANANVGGTNARQIGLGSKSGAISTAVDGQGSAQTTNNPWDIMITGDSFFVVSNGAQNFFTRDGSFRVDGAGNLVMASTGYNVMGWKLGEDGTAIKPDNVTALKIMSDENMQFDAEATSKGRFVGNIDAEDPDVTSKAGKSMNLEFYDSMGYKYTARFSVHSTGNAGKYYIQLDDVLDSSGKTIGADAVSRITFGQDNLTISASDGYTLVDGTATYTPDPADATAPGTVKVQMNSDANVWYEATENEEIDVSGLADDAKTKLEQLYGIDFDASGATKFKIDKNGNLTVTQKTVKKAINVEYSINDGKFVSAGGNGEGLINLGLSGAAGKFSNIEIDMHTTTNVSTKKTATIGAKRGMDKNDEGAGRPTGDMDKINIDKTGLIVASYTNGQSRILGQIAVANFSNPSGLEKAGDNLYAETLNSGTFDGIGSDISANGGYMTTGVLEMSNVDLSSEFTEMITTQRGFQANSRIITVSDTMLEELTNLKR